MKKTSAKKSKKKKVRREIWCHYRPTWVPLSPARKRCPVCGAVLKAKGDLGHKFRTVK